MTEISMTSISSLLVLLTLVFYSNARSLNSNDVPTPSKNLSPRILPLSAASFGRANLANVVEKVIVMNAKRKSQPLPLSSLFESAIPALSKQNERLLPSSVIKFKSPVIGNYQQKDEISLQRRERPGNLTMISDQVKVKTKELRDEFTTTEGSTSVSTEAPVVTTTATTEDPWEDFCNHACGAGAAGPECRCAGHPVGRRHAP